MVCHIFRWDRSFRGEEDSVILFAFSVVLRLRHDGGGSDVRAYEVGRSGFVLCSSRRVAGLSQCNNGLRGFL